MLLTLKLKIGNFLDNLLVLMSVANKNIKNSGILNKNLFKSKKTSLTKNLAKSKKLKNYSNLLNS